MSLVRNSNIVKYFESECEIVEPLPLIMGEGRNFITSGGPSDSEIENRIISNSRNKYITCQPCIRYWDIPNIGDDSHLSCFEMAVLWKRCKKNERVLHELVLRYLRSVVKEFNMDRIWATYYNGGSIHGKEYACDERSRLAWKENGINEEHIVGVEGMEGFVANSSERYGGYRSELYYEIDSECRNGSARCLPGYCNCGRFLEIVTDVQYKFRVAYDDRVKSYCLQEMRNEGVEACGFGIDRVCSIEEGSYNIWNIDRNMCILKEIGEECIIKDKREIARVVDSNRALILLLSEGVEKTRGKRNSGRRWILNKYYRVLKGFYRKYEKYREIIQELVYREIADNSMNRDKLMKLSEYSKYIGKKLEELD